MAQTIQQRALDLLNELVTTGEHAFSDTMFDDWATEGARRVVGMLPDPLCEPLLNSTAATSNPTEVDSSRILHVWRNDGNGNYIKCQLVPPHLKSRILNSNSIHQATSNYPRYTYNAGEVTIAPVPSASPSDGKIEFVNTPTVDSDTDTSITGLDNELESAVISFTVYRALHRQSLSRIQDALQELKDVEDGGYLTNFENTLPTFTSIASISTTAIDEALTKAKELIDTTTNINMEAQLSGDDVELAAEAVRGAAQEVGRAQIELQEEVQKHTTDLQAESAEFNATLNKAISYLEEARTRLQTTTQNMNLSQASRAISKDMYGDFIDTVQGYLQSRGYNIGSEDK